MIDLTYFIKKFKDVKAKDIIAFVPMICARVLSPLYKKKYEDTWLICEEGNEARDNGYWFFYKMQENHPDQPCIYAIDKKSKDYKKVKDLGEVVQYGSLKHWILYFVCQYNISSQKGGKPNAAVCSFIELNNWFNARNIFLQHGIIINDAKWLYAECSRFDLFITSAQPEKEFIEQKFGYPKGTIVLTGLPRFDNLHNFSAKKNRIVIMPSWRSWFKLNSQKKDGLISDFLNSDYYLKWREFLEDRKLNQLIDDYHLEIFFYPHRNMQDYLVEFQKNINSKVIMASWEEYDIQDLLISSSLMITDYSSVFFDMVYMKKPVIFYQFDLEDFRLGQYEAGYFDYANNPFAQSFQDSGDVIDTLKNYLEHDCTVNNEFKEAHTKYFPLYDVNNSERVYQAIKKISTDTRIK